MVDDVVENHLKNCRNAQDFQLTSDLNKNLQEVYSYVQVDCRKVSLELGLRFLRFWKSKNWIVMEHHLTVVKFSDSNVVTHPNNPPSTFAFSM